MTLKEQQGLTYAPPQPKPRASAAAPRTVTTEGQPRVQQAAPRREPTTERPSREYTGTSAAIHPEDAPRTTSERPRRDLAARPPAPVVYRPRPPETAAPPRRRRRAYHPLVYLGVGMVASVVCPMDFLWIHGIWMNVQYGYPRSFQVDARVGHNDDITPSHFSALNLAGHLSIVEYPGGDASKALVYVGPVLFTDNQGETPITLEFRDVTGDGKPDMLIHVGDMTIVFVNDGARFRPQRLGDPIHL
jgi:hypothetical protein